MGRSALYRSLVCFGCIGCGRQDKASTRLLFLDILLNLVEFAGWLTGNADHADGPTGHEVATEIAPSFVGGIVILNGTFNNTISNNQIGKSVGADLVWAQSVPSAGSPIGVLSEPPVLHCNVTASEGGGGVSKHNGNVWSGNIAKVVDSRITQQ